jgi:hypothetical protein
MHCTRTESIYRRKGMGWGGEHDRKGQDVTLRGSLPESKRNEEDKSERGEAAMAADCCCRRRHCRRPEPQLCCCWPPAMAAAGGLRLLCGLSAASRLHGHFAAFGRSGRFAASDRCAATLAAARPADRPLPQAALAAAPPISSSPCCCWVVGLLLGCCMRAWPWSHAWSLNRAETKFSNSNSARVKNLY